MKVSISALSIAYGLTPEALRYYEEKGLLTPDRTASSGFRRFSIQDVQRLGIIKSLQKLGFSLDEVRKIMTSCTLEELVAMMDGQRRKLRQQIEFTRAIYNRLSAATDVLRDSPLVCLKPQLTAGCAAYLVDFDSVAALWNSVPTMPLLRDLIDALPLTSYCTVVPLDLLRGRSVPLRTGVCAPVEYLTAIRADFSRMALSAGPRAVRVVFELCPPEVSSIQPAIDAALAFIRERKLTPVCAGYTRQYAWFRDERDRMRHYSELILPVSE